MVGGRLSNFRTHTFSIPNQKTYLKVSFLFFQTLLCSVKMAGVVLTVPNSFTLINAAGHS
jgi:hypothetical protein